MSSARSVVTPAAPFFPPANGLFSSSTTPPLPPTALAGVAGPSAGTSPSPRSRRSSAGRNPGYPGSRSHFPFSHDNAIDNAPPAGPDLPWAPATSRLAPPNPNPPRSSSLAASNPPRTSSLLPPASIVVHQGSSDASPLDRSDWFNDPRPAPKIPEPAGEGDSSRHKRGHSRSSSAGGLSDTLRNLNRWSASTTSSRASHLAEFTRRVSAEILGVVAFNSSPGRKFHRRRPSTSGGSPRSSPRPKNQAESPVAGAVPPLLSLPRILAGPSLEHEVFEAHVLGQTAAAQEEEAGRHQQPRPEGDGSWNVHPSGTNENGSLSNHFHAAEPQPPEMLTHETTMTYAPNGQARSRSGSGSTGATGGVEIRERDRDRERDRGRQGRPMSQKAMLARALQKANTAVRLDNAQNFEGARRAYAEACAVLRQVLLRTPGEDDRRRLEAIHETYLARVMELDEQLIHMEPEGKELPRRPESNDFQDMLDAHIEDDRFLRGMGGALHDDLASAQAHDVEGYRRSPPPPPSRASPLPDSARDARDGSTSYLTQQYSLQSAFSRARYNNGSALRPPTVDHAYMPPPLSPRRPASPARPSSPPVEYESPRRAPADRPNTQLAAPAPSSAHQRANSHESVSWLDPIDESDRSSVTSVHSRSSYRIVRKHIRAPSGATEAEFDAALDDAIEAAYDDGYEPEFDYPGYWYHDAQVDPIKDELGRGEMARDLVGESERDALELATEREERLRLQQQLEDEEYEKRVAAGEDFYDRNDSEEEERLLEEAPRTDGMDDFAFGVPQRPPVPRESDSSGTSGRTWHSSVGSNSATGATLTPVSEDAPYPHRSGPLPPLPPQVAAPVPPQPSSAESPSSAQSVRNRRLSGQNPKELTIETRFTVTAAPATAGPALPPQPKTGNYIIQQRQALSAGSNRAHGPFTSRSGPSPAPGSLGEEPEDGSLRPAALPHDEHLRVGTPSVVRAPDLRKNYSASSLKSLKTRNLSITHVDEVPSEQSPGTPLSSQFGSRLPAVPSLPTGILHTHLGKDRANSATTSGLHLFENEFHSSDRPGTPNPLTADAPAPLEPCPTDAMLRPFWLMRALYQTLCHPRGGYLSNKLFVPRDVWRVKGVKLKAVEDKIANCDLLTAALQKLARVDTCDADAVLEEMQAFEGVLEQVQATLSRKLGSEVGVQGASSMFKDAAAAAAAAAAGDAAAAGGDGATMPRSASVAGKASSFSWRRLRSKNSSANLPGLSVSGYGSKGGNGGGGGSTTNLSEGLGKDATLASLPMTTHPTSRPTKRDVHSVTFTGPNANYMSSLARLFDAAQTVDQIARQVDDPGLRHADKTQVGLELCTRHAAEFFAFYVCRFALSDLTLLMDKFVKRGSEWVLA
ncbi:hypothetical protein VTH06DRAFT_7388 [Thermothelomyces fergusii]